MAKAHTILAPNYPTLKCGVRHRSPSEHIVFKVPLYERVDSDNGRKTGEGIAVRPIRRVFISQTHCSFFIFLSVNSLTTHTVKTTSHSSLLSPPKPTSYKLTATS